MNQINKGKLMNLYKLFLMSIFGAAFVLNLSAQEKLKVSIQECIKIGLENSKTLKVSQSKVSSAEFKVEESNAAQLGTLKFTGAYTRLSPVDPFQIGTMVISPALYNNYTLKLTASQPLFTGYRLSSAAEISDYNLQANKEDYSKDKSQLILDIKNAYLNLYKAYSFLSSINETIGQTKAHLKDIENFSKSGLATTNDVLKVKVQLSNLELSKIDAENGIKLSMMGLNNLIGLPLNSDLDIEKTIADPNYDDYNLDNSMKVAVNERNEIKSMQFREKAGESSIKMAESGYYPQINLNANYNYANPNSRIFPSKEQFDGTWDVGVSISYDIWNWSLTSKQAAQAQESLEQTKIAISQLKDAISLEVSQSYLTYSKSKEKIKVSDETVKQAEENLRVTNEKFKTGLAINSDLLDAEISLLQAKINYTSAIVDYEMAKAKLERSIGKQN
jgi:outer membrane protein TolC